MSPADKPLVWLSGEVKTPPFSREARLEAGSFLRLLQKGQSLGMPHSRPMPSIGPNCHELRIRDQNRAWRIFYRVEANAITIAAVEPKTTEKTPDHVIQKCKSRLRHRDQIIPKAEE